MELVGYRVAVVQLALEQRQQTSCHAEPLPPLLLVVVKMELVSSRLTAQQSRDAGRDLELRESEQSIRFVNKSILRSKMSQNLTEH